MQDIVVESQERNKRMLSSICHVRSVLQEEMQLDPTSIDTLENSDIINITSVLESAYNDSDTEVADMVKFHLDSQLPVLVKGPLEFDCKVFNRVPQRDISIEFLSPNAPIDSIPPVLRINDCKWVDTGQLSDSFDRRQYNQIKLLNAPKLFDKMAERSRWLSMLHDSEYIGEVEVLIECSDNLTSFCNYYKLLGVSLDNSFLYSLDWAATSRVERYTIDQFTYVRGNCKRSISVERTRLASSVAFRLSVWTPLSPQQEQVEGILMLVGQIEGLSDYDYDLCVVYVPDGEFLSSIRPTNVNYWETYTGSNSVKEWRKHFNIILPMLMSSIRVTYGAYIVTCFVDGKILKSIVLHNEMVVQEIISNIMLCIHKFCNEHTPLEAGFVLVAGRTWLEYSCYILFNCYTGRAQLGGFVMEEVGTDAFINFDQMTKSSDLVFLLFETLMFDIHKSNGPLSDVVKKCILMFFEISENRAEHNNLYEAISKNIHFGILVATNSLALSSVVLEHSKMDLVAKLAAGVTHVFGLSLALTYVTVDVVSHVLIYAYTTILRIFTKTAYSFHNITRMQKYLQDPSKFTTITVAPVPATFCDPYGTQTWRKPLETTDA
ncbi:hypothetical protein FXO38_15907 [Capsicum annuum]|uniref:Uncharacterized protein n=1 Tax=Capsicum annuum TaxID=4072 RepID=A0A2G2ZTS9_CAPAN|nr:hypothetical protein FXO38_15907 [Capsicum annuum]KAF3654624.1 hypothetical protein FXO37_16382 [Capsicum annuum]PHT85379.1 hypothetical protein T459_07485 [Capsicum annuum]